MKVFAYKVNDVTLANVDQGSAFTVDDGGKMVLTILRNAYSAPIEAVVRELSQNASEVDPNFRIHLPTTLEPYFSVIDNGTGLSDKDVVKYFSGLGASTKDNDNTKVGGFGIGCKVPFAVVNDYTIISRYNGKKSTYLAYLDDYEKPMFTKAAVIDTIEPNGIEVRVPVKSDQFSKYKEAVQSQLQFFDPKPDVNTDIEYDSYDESKLIKRGTNYAVYERVHYGYGYSGEGSKSKLVMGNLWYTIDAGKFTDLSVKTVLSRSNIVITLPIGSCTLPMSREGLLYNDKTIRAISDVVKTFKEDFKNDYEATINSEPTFVDAYMKYVQLKRTHSLLFGAAYGGNTPTWKGKELRNIDFVQEYSVAFECHTLNTYDVQRRKTLSIRDRKVSTYLHKDTGHYVYRLLAQCEDDYSILLYNSGKDRKTPSTISYNVKEKGFASKTSTIICIDVDDKANLRSILTTLGFKNIHDIEDLDVPPVNKRVAGKSLPRIYLYDDGVHYYYGTSTDKHRYKEYNIADLDKETGVYIEYKAWIPVDHTESITGFLTLIEKGLLPKGTNLYGIPANVKNELKDHPNYMSLSEAMTLAEEVCKCKLGADYLKRIRLLGLIAAINETAINPTVHGLNKKGLAYRVINDYNNHRLNNMGDELTKMFEYLFNRNRRGDQSKIDKYETLYEEKLNKAYPMLPYLRDNIPTTMLVSYLNEKDA